jgi:mannosyltransferase
MISLNYRLRLIAKKYTLSSATQYGLLLGVTLLATLLRFYRLGEWSFWIDEIFTVLRAQTQFATIEAIQQNIFPVRNWIPLSLIFTGGALNLLGTNEWSARLVSAVIGILSIPVLYFPIKKMFGWSVGLLAVLLLSVSPWHIYWSQNARFFTSLMLFYTLAIFAFFFGLEQDRLAYILLFTFLTYLATSERLLALFIMPVVVGHLLLLKILPFEKPPGLRFRNLLFFILPGIAIISIELYSYISSGTLQFFAYDWFFLYRSDDPLRLLSFIGFDISVPLMCFAFFSGVYLMFHKSRAGLLIFLGAVVPVVLLLLMNPFIFTKDRYAFVTLPSWIILGAVGIRQIFSDTRGHGKILAVGLLFVVLADAAGLNLMYYHVNNGNRRDWKGAFAMVKQRSKQDDLYVSYWPELGQYYLKEEVISWEEIDPDTVLESAKRYWFVLDSETIYANKEMKTWVEQNARLIDVKYLRTPDDFYLRIYLFDPNHNTIIDHRKITKRGDKIFHRSVPSIFIESRPSRL